MRAAFMYGAGDVRVEEVAEPKLEQPTDALVRIVRACVCGSDLHPYHQMSASAQGVPMGHEFVGVVEAAGSEVSSVKAGDVVISPFAWSDNTCDFCREGFQTSCRHGGFYAANGIGGAQAEAIRVPLPDGTLVKAPVAEDSALVPSLLTLSDVFLTGHHAVVRGGVNLGSTVTVIGDGAVGLSAVLAARRLGAERIILMGRHADRTGLGRQWGATDVVAERGEEGTAKVLDLTGGDGTHVVVEAVGHRPAYDTGRRCRAGRRHDQPGRCPAVRGGAGRVRQPVRQERHPHRWPRPGPRLHRGTAAPGARRPPRAWAGVRPYGQPRGHPRRVPADGRP